MAPSALNPASHPYANLLYYPGHSASPIHYLSSPPEQRSKDHHVLAFYALDTTRGDMRLCIVLLRYDEFDTRIANMRMSLYPGSVLELSPICFNRKEMISPSFRPRSTVSDSARARRADFTLDDILFVRLKFRYPMPRSTVSHCDQDANGASFSGTEIDTDVDRGEEDGSESQSQSGWWRNTKDWGTIVKDDRKEAFVAALDERLSEFLELMD
ncbi:hypothetical protein IAU59_001461 [Kwoniella sp. CBS 9459]